MSFTLKEIADWCGGRLYGDPECAVSGFFTDSRQAEKGRMFVPVKGERVDAHQFIPSVFELGAASFSQELLPEAKGDYVLVEDTVKALQTVAMHYRLRFSIPFLGVTGSVGKTTTKEMVALALEAGLPVLKTAGNANSQVGLPLTLLRVEEGHKAAVIEMGMSLPGEMARIACCARPDLAVFTNVGVSHIEFHGTREKILEEKLHIADFFTKDSVLFVNGDDDLLAGLTSDRYGILRFGLGENCAYRAVNITQNGEGSRFVCLRRGGEVAMSVPVPGMHNVRNALVALAVAEHLGVATEKAVGAIAGYTPPEMRQQIREIAGRTVIDDTYNASPDSMLGAVDILSTLEGGKKIAVLADMLELGGYSEKGHRDVGAYAREKKTDVLLTFGPEAEQISLAYGGENRRHFMDKEELIAYLKKISRPGDVLLVKGSRGMKMDEIVKEMENW